MQYSFPPALKVFERLPGIRTGIRSLLSWIALWREAGRSDVVHVLGASWVYFFAFAAPAVFIGKFRGRKVILNYRGGEAQVFFRQWGWAVSPLMRAADILTAPSEFIAGVIRNRFGLSVSIVPNIVDLSAFRFRHRTHFAPTMIVTRHLEEMYGIDIVLRAFRAVQQYVPEATLSIAGAGSEEVRLRQLAADWKLQNVTFLGQVEHRDLPTLYDRCDILINASYVDNFPGSLIEAAASGLAIVSTSPGGIPYIFENGKTALLVQPGDWESLAQSIRQILDSSALGQSLTAAAAAMVKNCDWPEVRSALEKVYGFGIRSVATPHSVEAVKS